MPDFVLVKIMRANCKGFFGNRCGNPWKLSNEWLKSVTLLDAEIFICIMHNLPGVLNYVSHQAGEIKVWNKFSKQTKNPQKRRIFFFVIKTMNTNWSHHYDVIKKVSSLSGQWPYQRPIMRLFCVILVTLSTISMIIPQVIISFK